MVDECIPEKGAVVKVKSGMLVKFYGIRGIDTQIENEGKKFDGYKPLDKPRIILCSTQTEGDNVLISYLVKDKKYVITEESGGLLNRGFNSLFGIKPKYVIVADTFQEVLDYVEKNYRINYY